MPRVVFTQNLRRHIDVEQCSVEGASVKESLENVFDEHPRMRGYLLDDRGTVRKHIAIILDGESIRDRENLSDPVSPGSEIFVMQGLSGG